MNRSKLAVVFGGASSEHEVSQWSAASILRSVPQDRFDLMMLGITKDGRWFCYDGPVEGVEDGSWEHSDRLTPALISPDAGTHGVLLLEESGVRPVRLDVVFPVLHGRNGEDGTIQGLLEMAGIPYVGCGVTASANCMDKAIAKTLFTAAGIPNARWMEVTAQDLDRIDLVEEQAASALGYPMFVKPVCAGSSVGVHKVTEPAQLEEAVRDALRFDSRVLIEECIKGQEVECAVMGNGQPVASDLVGEIAASGFYDYEGKYLNDSAQLYIPARIPQAAAERVRALAVKAYRALGCRGLARVDFFVCDGAEDGRGVVLNEINTLPGFTNISMYPKLFLASGYDYPGLVEKLIDLALEG
ncbi:MAG TPA: D-alanine--D-alanine ligase [Firmicutes bacterium]|nr:D-alanine--D-alanine ligase [Bacillota bacterium]